MPKTDAQLWKWAKRAGLPLFEEVHVPPSIVTEKVAILGASGSGKTYRALRLAELMLGIGAQVIYLDPVGVAWGLRAGAKKGKKGFPILIIGGDHGDIPLTAESGAVVAKFLVEKRLSAVIDLFELTSDELIRFYTDFTKGPPY